MPLTEGELLAERQFLLCDVEAIRPDAACSFSIFTQTSTASAIASFIPRPKQLPPKKLDSKHRPSMVLGIMPVRAV
jgi:hypothetical protein